MSAKSYDKYDAYDGIRQNGDKNVPKKIEAPKGFGIRHFQSLILFLSLSISYGMRAQLSVSIVAMTESQNPLCSKIDLGNLKENGTNKIGDLIGNITGYDEVDNNNATACNSADPTGFTVLRVYDWNESTREMIVFAFFVGYTSMMLPMGLIVQKYGWKIPICVGLFTNSVLSFLTPILALFGGWVAVCIARLLQGMTQSALYPSIHTMLAKWSPLAERGSLSSYIYTGSQFGTVLLFQIAGLLGGSRFGWPATFYFCGVCGMTCFGLVLSFSANSPYDHNSISAEELMFITGSGDSDVVPKKRKTPWKKILGSTPVWATVAAHVGSSVGYIFLLTQLPLYMNGILNVEIKKNGIYSSLPYIAMYFVSILFGWITDFINRNGYLSTLNIRRIFNSIGMGVSGALLYGFSFVGSTEIAVTLLVLCLASHSGVHVGFHINYIDLAPNFAGPLMSLGNMFAHLASLGVPILVSNIVGDDMVNPHRWQMVFLVVAALQQLTNGIFVIFAKGEVQPWNFHSDEEGEFVSELKIRIQEQKHIQKIEDKYN